MRHLSSAMSPGYRRLSSGIADLLQDQSDTFQRLPLYEPRSCLCGGLRSIIVSGALSLHSQGPHKDRTVLVISGQDDI